MKIVRFRKINERKSFAPFNKYHEILVEKYNATDIFMYSKDGKIHLTIETDFRTMSKNQLYEFLKKFDDLEYTFKYKESNFGVYLWFILDEVTDDFMKKLDIELEAKKYNV